MSLFNNLFFKITKILFLPFLLLLSSCEKSSWEYTCISNDKNNKFSTLIYKKQGSFELELLNLNGKILCYLNLLDFKIKKENPIPIAILSNGVKKKTFAYLREGSKRLCFDDDDKNLIIASLQNKLPLSIEIEDYSEDIDSELFLKNYKKFLENNNLISSFF